MKLFWTKKKHTETIIPVEEKPKFATPQDLVNFVLIECSDFHGEIIEYKYHRLILHNVENVTLERIVMLNDLLRQEFGLIINDLDLKKCKELELPSGFLEKIPLRWLSIHDCGITNLPNLSNNTELRYLSLFDNQLSNLPKLPKSLIYLNIGYNNFETIDELPSALEALWSTNNKLSELPVLPNNLKFLRVENNNLDKLPYLPSTLKEIDCSKNNIKELTLPPFLIELNCSKNKLTELKNIPRTLEKLWCWDNDIKNKPSFPWMNKDKYIFTIVELHESCERDRR